MAAQNKDVAVSIDELIDHLSESLDISRSLHLGLLPNLLEMCLLELAFIGSLHATRTEGEDDPTGA